jgi:hypothetical protein
MGTGDRLRGAIRGREDAHATRVVAAPARLLVGAASVVARPELFA